ncbi:MAG: hypothetical protein ACK5UQ_02325 [Planctomycetota bacterium]
MTDPTTLAPWPLAALPDVTRRLRAQVRAIDPDSRCSFIAALLDDLRADMTDAAPHRGTLAALVDQALTFRPSPRGPGS